MPTENSKVLVELDRPRAEELLALIKVGLSYDTGWLWQHDAVVRALDAEQEEHREYRVAVEQPGGPVPRRHQGEMVEVVAEKEAAESRLSSVEAAVNKELRALRAELKDSGQKATRGLKGEVRAYVHALQLLRDKGTATSCNDLNKLQVGGDGVEESAEGINSEGTEQGADLVQRGENESDQDGVAIEGDPGPEDGGVGRLVDNPQQVIVDFLDSWRFCPVSEASASARSCLEDAAGQLLAALTQQSTTGKEDCER